MLELVLGQVGCFLGLAVVALGGQLAVRLALLVALQPVVRDLPAGGNAVDDRAEGMADPRSVRAVAAKGAGLGAPVGMAQHEPVARRLQLHALVLDRVDEPVPALDVDEVALGQLGLAAIRLRVLVPDAVDVDELVVGGHEERLRPER